MVVELRLHLVVVAVVRMDLVVVVVDMVVVDRLVVVVDNLVVVDCTDRLYLIRTLISISYSTFLFQLKAYPFLVFNKFNLFSSINNMNK